ncbi:MAG: hypothetical protein QOH35_127 [Acidobacteriaceae bacterium]|nr:hypothetical protein [Acidobacteriaceae bacterium]
MEDTTYTSIYWKNHAMYFLPLAQRAGMANDPNDPLDKDQSTYAGALIMYLARRQISRRFVQNGPLAAFAVF